MMEKIQRVLPILLPLTHPERHSYKERPLQAHRRYRRLGLSKRYAPTILFPPPIRIFRKQRLIPWKDLRSPQDRKFSVQKQIQNDVESKIGTKSLNRVIFFFHFSFFAFSNLGKAKKRKDLGISKRMEINRTFWMYRCSSPHMSRSISFGLEISVFLSPSILGFLDETN